MNYLILPEFKYISEIYKGDYFYINNNTLFRLDISPKNKFNNELAIKTIYDNLNKFSKIKNLSISITKEMAEMDLGQVIGLIFLPIEILILNINNTDYVLRPKIDSVTVKKFNQIFVFWININLEDIIKLIEKIQLFST